MTFISRCWEDGEAIPTSNIFAHPRVTCKTFQSSSQCLVRHQNMQKNFSFCLITFHYIPYGGKLWRVQTLADLAENRPTANF